MSLLANNEIIKISIILNRNSDVIFFKNLFSWINQYLNIDVNYINDFNKSKLDEIDSSVDFCFVHFIPDYEPLFAWNFYSTIHEINKKFKMIFILNEFSKTDFNLFKNGGDDIIYMDNDFQFIKWKFFSLLRRKWDESNTKFTLIRNGVVIDLIKRKVIKNNKEINITKKEFQLLAILVEEFNSKRSFTTKQKIYKSIYKDNNIDNSRVVDQLIFRLKNKLGKDFISIEKKGIRII